VVGTCQSSAAFCLGRSAKAADSIRAAEVCSGIKPGEIVIFDRAYVDFVHLCALNDDGVFWVTRSKEPLSFRVVRRALIFRDPLSQKWDSQATLKAFLLLRPRKFLNRFHQQSPANPLHSKGTRAILMPMG
jgi:hypothetical protein